MLVEDDPNDAFFVQRALSELGFMGKLEHLTDTVSASRYMLGEGEYEDRSRYPLPQIVIADSSLAVRDSGVEFLEWMREQERVRDIPFIVLSGGVSEETRARAEAAGARRILTKASSYRELKPMLKSVLGELPERCRTWLR